MAVTTGQTLSASLANAVNQGILARTQTGRVSAQGMPTEAELAAQLQALVITAAFFGAAFVPPSNANNSSDRIAIEAAWNAGVHAMLLAGATYSVDRELRPVDGCKLFSSDERTMAVIVPASSYVVAPGNADARTFALYFFAPTLGAVNTTLVTYAPERALQIQLTSAAGVTEGMWVRMRGANFGGTDANGMSDGQDVILNELQRLHATTGGGWCAPYWPIRQWHAQTVVAVQSVTPLLGVEIRGVHFDARGALMPCAVSLESAAGVKLENVKFTGFSRAGVDIVGSRGVQVGHLEDGGGNNGLVYLTSCIDSTIGDGTWTYNPEGAYVCAAGGIARAKIWIRFRCTNVVLDPGMLGRGVMGIRKFGGNHVRARFYFAVDFDETLRDPVADAEVGWLAGVAWNGGAAPLNTAEFGRDTILEGFQVENFRMRTTGAGITVPDVMPCCAYLHDDEGVLDGAITIYNDGANPVSNINGGTNYGTSAIHMNDMTVRGGVVHVRGQTYGIVTHGALAQFVDSVYNFDGSSGDGSSLSVPLHIDAVGALSMHQFSTFHVANAVTRVRFGANFNANPDYISCLAKNFDADATPFPNIYIATVGAINANVLDVLELDTTSPAGTRRCVVPGGASTNPVVVAVGGPLDVSSNTCILISTLPQTEPVAVAGGAATAMGTPLESNAARKAVAGAATRFGQTYLGRAIETTAGAGAVKVVA